MKTPPHIRFSEPSCAGTWQNNLLSRSNVSGLHAAFFVCLFVCFCYGEEPVVWRSGVKGQVLMFESREMSGGVGKEARLHTLRAWNHVYFINSSTASVFGNLGGRRPDTEHRYTLHPGKKRETKRHFGLGIQTPTS